ncbi:MAG: response regulator [Candidatus Omnitrophica bacterium]|nr:response regulator [Candidatus Omnitrophota bacterium]
MLAKKILIVDDDKKVTEGVGAFLKAIGHDMLLALDGHQAMEYINKEGLALVLLDIQLPGIPGMEILSTLRKKRKDINVFIITAYSKDVKWRCDQIGYDKFFAKPIELDPLLDAIKEVIAEKKEEAEEIKHLEGVPKAKVLFITPNVNIFGYTCGLFNSKEFNSGEYETKVAYSITEALDLFKAESLYAFSPDIVVIYDFNTELNEIDKLADYIMSTSFKPKEVIMHGIFSRSDFDIEQLKKKGIKYCSQNIMTDEDLRRMNKILIDFIGKECIRLKLIKQ